MFDVKRVYKHFSTLNSKLSKKWNLLIIKIEKKMMASEMYSARVVVKDLNDERSDDDVRTWEVLEHTKRPGEEVYFCKVVDDEDRSKLKRFGVLVENNLPHENLIFIFNINGKEVKESMTQFVPPNGKRVFCSIIDNDKSFPLVFWWDDMLTKTVPPMCGIIKVKIYKISITNYIVPSQKINERKLIDCKNLTDEDMRYTLPKSEHVTLLNHEIPSYVEYFECHISSLLGRLQLHCCNSQKYKEVEKDSNTILEVNETDLTQIDNEADKKSDPSYMSNFSKAELSMMNAEKLVSTLDKAVGDILSCGELEKLRFNNVSGSEFLSWFEHDGLQLNPFNLQQGTMITLNLAVQNLRTPPGLMFFSEKQEAEIRRLNPESLHNLLTSAIGNLFDVGELEKLKNNGINGMVFLYLFKNPSPGTLQLKPNSIETLKVVVSMLKK